MFKVPEEVRSKYIFILIAAERAKMLLAGAQPKIEPKHTKPTYIAIEELLNGKIKFVIEGDKEESEENKETEEGEKPIKTEDTKEKNSEE